MKQSANGRTYTLARDEQLLLVAVSTKAPLLVLPVVPQQTLVEQIPPSMPGRREWLLTPTGDKGTYSGRWVCHFPRDTPKGAKFTLQHQGSLDQNSVTHDVVKRLQDTSKDEKVESEFDVKIP